MVRTWSAVKSAEMPLAMYHVLPAIAAATRSTFDEAAGAAGASTKAASTAPRSPQVPRRPSVSADMRKALVPLALLALAAPAQAAVKKLTFQVPVTTPDDTGATVQIDTDV